MIARAPRPTTAPPTPDPAAIAPGRPPRTPAELHAFLRERLDIEVADAPMLPASTAPFHYLVHTFFEGRFAPSPGPASDFVPTDAVLWANRGGGKTFLGAVATMLDLVFKPAVQVRILGGSLEQSRRMHDHLRRLFDHPALADLIDGRMTEKRLRLKNGACAEILAQSETAVRGTRVQKLRCDEVELFDRDVWLAAQLTTRSLPLRGPWGPWVRGSIEALSTMHRPFGLMWDIVAEAGGLEMATSQMAKGPNANPRERTHSSMRPFGPLPPSRRRLFRWGVLDVLAPCGPEHACDSCALWDECGGRAKGDPHGVPHGETPRIASRAHAATLLLRHPAAPPPPRRGHITVADALALKARVDPETWRSEMLCLSPRRSHCVYPEFDPAVHVFDGHVEPPASAFGPAGTLICGMDFGFRAPTVVLWALVAADGTLRIIDERIAAGSRLEEHARAITDGGAPGARGWPAPAWIGIDPAGNARSEQTGVSNAHCLRAAGLAVRTRAMPIHAGVNLVRARLAPADASAPRLLVHRRCTGLIEALQRYHYDESRPESLDPVKDGPDHAADALRYLVVGLDRPYLTKSGKYVP